jgi:hypothetical protein
MSNGNGKTRTYNDPAKQLSRIKLREFIERHFSEKKRKDLRVLCLPGAEAEGEEALEVKEVYDPLGIPRRNIVGLECNPEVADRLERAKLGIEVIPTFDWQFFQDTDRRFDVISLDYKSNFGDEQRYSIDLIAANKLLGERGVLATNYYGARENSKISKDLTLFDKIRLNGFDPQSIYDNPEVVFPLLHSDDVKINQGRSRGIQVGVGSQLIHGECALDIFKIKIFAYIPGFREKLEPAISQMDKENKKYIIARNANERFSRTFEARSILFGAFCDSFLKQGMNQDLVNYAWLWFTRPYQIDDHESYSYISNKSSPMFLDLWYVLDMNSRLRKDFFRCMKGPRGPKIYILEGYQGRKRKELWDRAITIGKTFFNEVEDKILIPRKFLGSASDLERLADEDPQIDEVRSEQTGYNEQQLLPIITKEQAIDLIRQGKSSDEILESYSGITRRELGSLKAWYAPGNEDNGLHKPKSSNNGKPKKRKEDLSEIVDFVRSEIESNILDDDYRLTRNNELAELIGSTPGRVTVALKNGLTDDERDYRRRVVLAQTAKETIRNGRGIGRLSTKERIKIGTDNYENGKGIGGLTEEERRQIGTDNYNNGKGIGSLTEDERRAIGTRNSEKRMTVAWKDNLYHSASEAAIADLFIEYIPGFSIEKGKTWQVNGNGLKLGAIDFMVNGSFVEYHPPRAYYSKKNCGDLRSPEEYHKFKIIKARIKERSGRERVFQRRIENIIKTRYQEARISAIEDSGYKGTPFIYCADIKDVYEKIIVPYSNYSQSLDSFKRKFNQRLKQIKRSNEKPMEVAS